MNIINYYHLIVGSYRNKIKNGYLNLDESKIKRYNILYIVKTKNIYEGNYFKIIDGITVGEKGNEIDFSSFTVYIINNNTNKL